MKSKFILPIALTLIAAGASALHAASTTIDATTAKPTIGTDDVYSYLTPPSPSWIGGQDFTNNFSNGAGSPGQTFNATTSGLLTAITIQGLQGQAGNGYQGGTFNLFVYSVGSNGTDLTELEGATFTFANQTTDATKGTVTDYSGYYLTFDLPTTVSLTSGDKYAFTFAGPAGYYALAGSGSTGSDYSGGSAIAANSVNSSGNKTSTDPSKNIASSYTYDRNFDAHISEVPEPSTWAMMIGGLVFLVALQRRRLA